MNTNVYIAVVILVCAVCTFSERLFPFLIFGKHKVPRVVRYLGKVLPMAIMMALVVYCLRHVSLLQGSHGLPELITILLTVGLHIWKRQMLLSIAGGTVCYMLLIQFIF